MALFSMLRRSSPSLVPLAILAVGSSRNLHGPISSQHFRGPFNAGIPKSDVTLLQAVKDEINGYDYRMEPDLPDRFHFKIQDNPHERSILLTRVLSGENITIKVGMPHETKEARSSGSSSSHDDHQDISETKLDDNSYHNGSYASDRNGAYGGYSSYQDSLYGNSYNNGRYGPYASHFRGYSEDDKDNDFSNDEWNEDNDVSNDKRNDDGDNLEKETEFPMTMTLCKGNGLCLECKITASAVDIVSIDSLSFKEENKEETECKLPDAMRYFSSSFNASFLKFLATRGITSSTTSFLYKYMVAKKQRDRLLVMTKLEKFIRTQRVPSNKELAFC